jgi:two-component system alkaline phosphatase synthesis response regulator PhoP
MCKILIADDDVAMLHMVKQVLSQEGYLVLTARTAQGVIDVVTGSSPDLFLIGLVLPGMNGLDLCRKLRTNPMTAECPVIFLTGQRDAYSAAEALEAGGDDYIRKPFAVRELTARIRAHLRRISVTTTDNMALLKIVPNTYQVFVDQREVMLTRIEFDLLTYLCSNPQKWHGTQDLLTGVWNYPDGVGDTALVRNHIRNLRRKLESNPDHPAIIQSRHGRGYSIKANVKFA